MSDSQETMLRDAAHGIDLSLCEREMIQFPGAIQPHGALIAALADGLSVTHASANLLQIMGKSAHSVLGRPLAEVFDESASLALCATGSREGAAARTSCLLPAPGGQILHLDAYRSGKHICVDIEPTSPEPWQTESLTKVQTIAETFRQATTPRDLCNLAVRSFRALTGYDRVIVYHFRSDGHGEVIAEDCAANLERYLGICYPASDIPPQAHRQYLAQRVGMIGDAAYQPVPLLTDPALADATPLDLTHSKLRSPSPIHRQYMRNMGTAASLTIGLVAGEDLWGMLVCHHMKPRLVGPDLRAVAGLVGQVMSLLLVSLGEATARARQLERQADLVALVSRFSTARSMTDALLGAEQELLGLVGASGALVSYAGAMRRLGRTPAAAERALVTLRLATGGKLLAVDDLGLRYPALASCTGDGSGALLLPLAPGTDDAILWFRPELARTVSWGGNPADHQAVDPQSGHVSPRTSFAIWKETVSGRSAPWEAIDLTLARNLRNAIEVETAKRTEMELIDLRKKFLASEEPNLLRTLELEEFAYAASHDLKAPLRAIEHLAQWIREDIEPTAKPSTLENLKLLNGRVRRLQVLLNGLLAYSRVGRQTDAEIEDVDVGVLLADTVKQLAPPAGFDVNWPTGMPVIRTHRVQLGVVLTNLIGNALKHHDGAPGRVTIAMQAADGVAEFHVSDDGPGIAPQFHERIFVVFQTLASRDHVEGSGIGLAIVKKMVTSNGGTIRVESNPPARGSTFVFTWRDAAPCPTTP